MNMLEFNNGIQVVDSKQKDGNESGIKHYDVVIIGSYL